MPTKTDYTFKPTQDYESWADYFRARRLVLEAPQDTGPKEGETRTIQGVMPPRGEDIPRSAKTLMRYAEDWGFDVQVLQHTRERYYRGEWVTEEVVHVTGTHKGARHSAFHMRWINGKAQDCRIQINNQMPVYVGVTAAKKMMQEAV